MHGSRSADVPPEELDIGVAAFTRPEDNRLLSVLWLPFRAR